MPLHSDEPTSYPAGASTAPRPSPLSKSTRVLSCVFCQRRKIKCNRDFPCANCVRSQVECVPADPLRRPRKRRFPERTLLEQLRKYECLLRQNNIKFDPLHSDTTGEHHTRIAIPDTELQSEHEMERGSSATTETGPSPEAKNVWNAINQMPSDRTTSADIDERTVRTAWSQAYGHLDPIFGSRTTIVNLSSAHPQPAQAFRLWQIYLDNVDPLLKVTHVPTLQGQIIEAMNGLDGVDPSLEALIFSIYCIAILSLAPADCERLLGSPKQDLLTKYQSSCQQALINCGFLRSESRRSLTAYFLYLLSVRPSVDPRCLSSLLGIAVRIAQRMGIHDQRRCSECPPLEAEMRRRLWWSLVLTDTRIGEMADHRSTLLTPLWDAAIPLNVNDVDLRLGMRVLPPTHDSSTEMLFLVARSEVADFIRHSSFHLDLTNPALKPLAKDASREEGYDLALLERTIEEKYLRFCNEDNPLHVFTKWMTRDYLAKCYLAEHYSKFHTVHLTDDQRDTAICVAMRRLECDTRVMSSHLTQGYLWLLQFHMPFVAYIHILQDLKRRPLCKHAEHAWEILSDNFEVRSTTIQMAPVAIFKNFTELVLQSWMARDAVSDANIRNPVTPQIVSTVRFWLMQNSADAVADLTCGTTSVGANSPERGGSFDLDQQGDPHSMEDIPETLPSPLSWRHRAEFVQELESETTRLDWLATDWVSRYYWS